MRAAPDGAWAGVLRDETLAAALRPVWAALPGARLVGGVVRDLLAGLAPADIDLATPLPPEQAMEALRHAGIRVVPTGLAHGTVTAISQGKPFEITTLRRDERTDGRHAEVAWTDDWQADAARRDFTINAMSLDSHGVLHDFFGGRGDLEQGRVRFVGAAAQRIAEDRLRILRFFRFQARFGRGAPDAEAMTAIAAQVAAVGALSPERIWMELKRLFATPDIAAVVASMQAAGVWRVLFGPFVTAEPLLRLLACGAPAEPLLRLAALTAGADSAAVADRLRLSRAEAAQLLALTDPAPPLPEPDADDDMLRRLLAESVAGLLVARIWLGQAARRAAPDPACDALRARLAAMPRPVFPLAGKDGLAVGLKPGPGLGTALAATRRWWLERGCRDGYDACLDRLRKAA